jgi:zinc transport system permease protein
MARDLPIETGAGILLIIPAAAARPFARTPEQMAVGAAGVGALSAIGGLMASLTWDTPAGPSIVVVATALFVVGLVLGAVIRGRAG